MPPPPMNAGMADAGVVIQRSWHTPSSSMRTIGRAPTATLSGLTSTLCGPPSPL